MKHYCKGEDSKNSFSHRIPPWSVSYMGNEEPLCFSTWEEAGLEFGEVPSSRELLLIP